MRLGLEPMQAACEAAGRPERQLRVVHVAGTNGKGSVCAMVESIARAAGQKTGLYTSPHLCRFAERIALDGVPLDDCTLAAVLGRALDIGPDLSFFETATLAALLAFRQARVDVAVLEVGLGGRLDATNVVPLPAAAAITTIALDHTDRLGSTLVEIAREKAGIAKPGLDIVLGRMPAEIHAAISAVVVGRGGTTTVVDDETLLSDLGLGTIGLLGEHQRDNARIAAALGKRIGASPEAIAQGLARVRWPGRLERIGPFLLDGAHNPDGVRTLVAYVRSIGLKRYDVALVFGALADKDWAAMLDLVAPITGRRVYVPIVGTARPSVAPTVLSGRHDGETAASVEEGLARLSAKPPPLVLVCGSLALVGRARAHLLGLPCDPPVAL